MATTPSLSKGLLASLYEQDSQDSEVQQIEETRQRGSTEPADDPILVNTTDSETEPESGQEALEPSQQNWTDDDPIEDYTTTSETETEPVSS